MDTSVVSLSGKARSFPLYVLLGMIAAAIFPAGVHGQTVLYRQVFGNSGGGNNIAASVKWSAYDAAQGAVDISGTGAGPGYDISHAAGKTTTLGNVNSTVTATSTSVGYFFTQGVAGPTGGALPVGDVQLVIPNATESTYFGANADLDPSHYSTLTFSWEASNLNFISGVNVNVLRLAVEVGGNWYVSATSYSPPISGTFATSAVDESFVFTTLAASWNTLNFTVGSTLSMGSTAGSDLSGVIQNFGIFIQNTSGTTAGVSGFDTFTLTGIAVPEPSSLALVAIGFVGLSLGLRRRRVA